MSPDPEQPSAPVPPVPPVAIDGKQTGKRAVADCLALALASGSTTAQAARKCGCSERTAHRRLEDPAFRQTVAHLRGELVARAAGLLAAKVSAAARTLRDLLTAKSETVRLGAARSILELAARFRESLDIDARLRQLEERMANTK